MENINAVKTSEFWFDSYETLAAKYGEATIDAIQRDSAASARTGIVGRSPEVYDNARIAARYAALSTPLTSAIR